VVSLAYPVRLLLAVLAYLALYVVGANLAWALRMPGAGRLGRALDAVRQWDGSLWLGELLRLAYYLLVPYLVLYWGWASPLDYGLADLDWIGGIGATVAFGTGSLLLLAWVWWQHARLAAHPLSMRQAQWLEQPWGWVAVLREAIFLEASWALCRSPMLVVAGSYLGVYWGLVAVCAAALLNARTRHELRTPGHREGVILTGSLALVTATLYVLARNLSLCIALHFLLRLVILCLVRRADRRDPSQAAATDAPN